MRLLGAATEGPAAQEMGFWRSRWAAFRGWWWRNVDRRIPRLVWYGDEVDVRVMFRDEGAIGGDMSRVFRAQEIFHEMGIRFDSGSGCHGRDWEWDWSLAGPISVAFRGRRKRPERRTLKQAPALKVIASDRP